MSQLLPYILILVCPLTMGAMMWVMMRSMDHGKQPDPRVAELESQVYELRSAVSRRGQPDVSQAETEVATADRI
ncbi:MAG: DUF2933 domain-containing protein [Candidatus Dormibacteraeota bacterium]|nr:DUF2933 domain-containing protein [Candidatus Dormibacteraeota bacterium]